MKKMYKAIAITLITAIMLCSVSVYAGAVRSPMRIGDADGDWEVTVLDATRIQRWLTGLNNMDKLHQFLSDVNRNGEVDILDATRIQRKLASLDEFYNESFDGLDNFGYFGYYISDHRFYADHDSGKARVGVPMTFHADAMSLTSENYGDPQLPMTYVFYIDNSLVQERSENNELIYTFDSAGIYDICVVMYNSFDYSAYSYIFQYSVVEDYSLERPVIVSALFKDDTYCGMGRSPLYVRAEGGSGDYKYMYTITGKYEGCQDDGFFIEEPIDSNSKPVLSTGYIDSNVFSVPSPLNGELITVYARDSKGNVSEPVTVRHVVQQLIG